MIRKTIYLRNIARDIFKFEKIFWVQRKFNQNQGAETRYYDFYIGLKSHLLSQLSLAAKHHSQAS